MSSEETRFTIEEPKKKLDISKHAGVWGDVEKIEEHLVHIESLLQHGGERKKQQMKIRLSALCSVLEKLMKLYKKDVLDKLSEYEHSRDVVEKLFRCYLLYEDALYRRKDVDPVVIEIISEFGETRNKQLQTLFSDVKDVYDRYYKINKHFPPRNNHH